MEGQAVQLYPGAADDCRMLAEDLRAELRKLIERVDFIPLEGLGKFDLRVHGSLAVLLGLNGTQKAENPTARSRGGPKAYVRIVGRPEGTPLA